MNLLKHVFHFLPKMDYLEKFNEVFQDMISDLVKVFPDDSEFLFYQMAIKAGIMTNHCIVSDIFHKSVSSGMADKVLACDEEFFLEKDYSEYKSSKRDVSQIVKKLKNCWNLLNDENRKVIWRYLKILVLLDRRIHE